MKENWSRQPHASTKAAGDKSYSLLSYDRPIEPLVNAVTALKPPWNQLGCYGER
jgi:hypothetical protein